MSSDPHYWDVRSAAAFEYRGERFYTITPVTCYCERRRRIMDALQRLLATLPPQTRILDYGCGDGAYLRMLARSASAALFGCDICAGFVARARDACGGSATVALMQPGRIPFETTFDCIYSVAVLAHILDDAALCSALRDVRAHLSPQGVFFMAEATAWWRRTGKTWTRRTPADYTRLLRQCGLRVVARHTWGLPLFFYYEHLVLAMVRTLAFRGTREERMLAMNRNRVVCRCNDAVMRLARHGDLPLLIPTHTTWLTAQRVA